MSIFSREYQKTVARVRELEAAAREYEQAKEILALEAASHRVRAEIAKLSMEDIDRAEIINRSLALLGGFLRVSRVCLQILHEKQKVAITEYEWLAPGIKPSLGTKFKLKEGGWITESFMQGKIVRVDASQLRGVPRIGRLMMKLQGIRSFFGVPFCLCGKPQGFFSLDECARERVWKDEEIELFKDAAKIFELVIERKDSEARLRESEERFRMMFNASHDLMSIADLQCRTLMANPAWSKVLGYLPADQGDPFEKIHPDDRAAVLRAVKELSDGRIESVQSEYRYRTVTGEYVYLETTAERKTVSEQALLYVVAHNITERKRSEKLLEQRARELEDANTKLRGLDQIKADFLSNVSHELRTPLTPIKGFAAALLKDKAMAEEKRLEFLGIINEEADRLTVIINRLLKISAIEVGKVELKREPMDFLSAAREVIGIYLAAARTKRIDFSADLPAGQLPVLADKDNIREAFAQILDNAVKYTKSDGRIGVVIRDEGEQISVAVSDSGCGISRDKLPYIFTPFFRVDDLNERVGGIGLGLSLAKKIIEEHDGVIRAESQPGKGSRFSFALPKRREAA